ncbi:hypothetical protein ABD68_05500 [Bacillus endophyticus]|nr:hypothetical protein [Priestia endophytica]
MQQYTGFFITLALIFIIVIANKYLFWWVKGLIIIYYLLVSYFFIIVKNRIDQQYKDILPVPDAYWIRNSEWVDRITNYLFLPLMGILIFIYFKWFTKARTKRAKLFIVLCFIPSAMLFIIFSFLFSFSYGYSP